MKQFVDTNIFIYTLFPIDREKHPRSRELFEKADQGEISLWTTEWVIAELIWFLERKKISRTDCKQIVHKILASSGLEVRSKQWILDVLELWNESFNFVDAIHLISLKNENIQTIITYDKAFDTHIAVNRIEP